MATTASWKEPDYNYPRRIEIKDSVIKNKPKGTVDPVVVTDVQTVKNPESKPKNCSMESNYLVTPVKSGRWHIYCQVEYISSAGDFEQVFYLKNEAEFNNID